MEKRAYVFPGQGAQFVGMGHDLYQSSKEAKRYFDLANNIGNGVFLPYRSDYFPGCL